MPSLEQIGLPILVIGVIVALVGFFWLLRVAFSAGFVWGLAILLFHFVTFCVGVWLFDQAFESSIYLGAFALALVPYLLFVLLHRRKTWKPALTVVAGLGIIASPIAINWLVTTFVPEGPRVREVGGATHVTVTGLRDFDYASLERQTDIRVLQMANADVTDATLVHLKDLRQLEELDLNDTQITDDGLRLLAQLPALAKLRLRNTKISDAGFREHLLALDRLSELDLTGTAVLGKTAREWKSAREGRKILR